jgi:two-component system response regulator
MIPNAIDILLVEDNLHDVELTLHSLKKVNIANRIVVMNDGAAALELLFGTGRDGEREVNLRPKVILLDLKLPKVDGLEVLRRVKGDERTKTIPVVVLTSSTEEQDIVESYRLGVNSYIVKPVDFDKFVESVSHLGFYWVLLNQPPEQ